MGLDYKQFSQYIQRLKSAKLDLPEFFEFFLLRMANRVIAKVKTITPVDTGLLRASWQIRGDKVKISYRIKDGKNQAFVSDSTAGKDRIRKIGKNYYIFIGNPVHYASFVEDDHMNSTRTNVVRGYHMLRIAIEDAEAAMQMYFDQDFQAFLKRKGVI